MDRNLPLRAAELRLETLRVFEARGFGHIGGAMSLVETIAVLYNGVMRVRPDDPDWAERDRLVCSKGHAGPVIYAALAEKGFFDREVLKTLNRPGTILPSHCDMKTPGIDMTTGSLGQGISTAVGLAIGQRLRRAAADNVCGGGDGRCPVTYLILGDGECNEGQIWEGLMLAAHKKLNNLIVFCDYNKKQLDGWLEEVLDMGDLAEKFRAFGFFTQTVNGHDTAAIAAAVDKAQNYSVITDNEERRCPSMIILDTVKGRGCTFAENVCENHHIAFKPEQMAEALKAAEERVRELGGEVRA
jgi:transketolase